MTGPPRISSRAVGAVLAAAGWRADEPPSGVGAQRERWENVAALMRLAREAITEAEAAAAPAPTLASFTADLAERAAAQHVPTVDGVTLASLHAAKGLEWDAVFLVSLVEGVLPISYATTPEAVEEERRLLYVGVTRARRHLHCPGPRRARPGRRPRKPCRFLEGSLRMRWPAARRRGRSGADRRRPSTLSCGMRCGSGVHSRRQSRSSPRTASSPMPPWRRSRASARPRCSSFAWCLESEPRSSNASDQPCSMSFRRRAKAPKLRAIAAPARFSTRHEKCRRNKYVACPDGAPLS